MPVLNQRMRDIIRDGYAQGLPIQDIAALAGTTYDSCRATASRMGLKHPNRFRPAKGDPIGWVYNSKPANPTETPQFRAWRKAKEGAAATLKEIQRQGLI